jgi:hypothetical protein
MGAIYLRGTRGESYFLRRLFESLRSLALAVSHALAPAPLLVGFGRRMRILLFRVVRLLFPN